MAVTANRPAPYTSPKATLGIIERYRSRGLPSPIDVDVLARSGVVSESLIPRTLQAMQALDLIDAKGMPTDTFEGLRLAPEAEYKKALADWLKAAYADVFNYVDPATDDVTRIRDAFRSYNPMGQQERMVTLFIGLCAAAGLIPEKEKSARSVASSAQRSRVPKAAPASSSGRRRSIPPRQSSGVPDGLPAPLAGLLATLPSVDTGWTKGRRDSFVNAFQSVLDFCVPVVSEDETPEDDGQED